MSVTTVIDQPAGYVVADHAANRIWEIDLALAGEVRSPKKRCYKAKRQDIVEFAGRDGTVERFLVQQTLPYCGYDMPNPPTQAQYTAVMDFFLLCCETPFQATTMLSARDYGWAIADQFALTLPRRNLIALGSAAFILSNKDLRSLVRALNIKSHSHQSSAISKRSAHIRCHKEVSTFATKLVDDLRGAGAEIFG